MISSGIQSICVIVCYTYSYHMYMCEYGNVACNEALTAKKREYAQQVHEVEHRVFTSLVLSTTGGMGREATTFYKRLTDGISRKEQKQYSVVMGWIHCHLSFAILRSAILCIHGSRFYLPKHELNITPATSEGHVPSAV